MNQFSASKSFTVTTLQDGKDGRDTANVVVEPQIISYPAVDGMGLNDSFNYYVVVKYTDPEGVVYDKSYSIISYNAPTGITLERDILNDRFKVVIPAKCTSTGTITATVNLTNSLGQVAQNITFSISVLMDSNFDATDLGVVTYKADANGLTLGSFQKTLPFVTERIVWVDSVSLLYGKPAVELNRSPNFIEVASQSGADIQGLVVMWARIQYQTSGTVSGLYKFTLVPEVAPTTYNPNFEDGDQTLADDCSDTICVKNAGDLFEQGLSRILYLPNADVWQYRRLTIYRFDHLQPGMISLLPYTINIKAQDNRDIDDYTDGSSSVTTYSQYKLERFWKVVLWSDGTYWNILESDNMNVNNLVTVR